MKQRANGCLSRPPSHSSSAEEYRDTASTNRTDREHFSAPAKEIDQTEHYIEKNPCRQRKKKEESYYDKQEAEHKTVRLSMAS